MLEEITYKVISYCSIPENISIPNWLSESGPDCYISYHLHEKNCYDAFETWLLQKYPELKNTTFLIEIDY